MPLEALPVEHRTFAVTGASGHVGGDLARRLISNGAQVRVLTRHPESLRNLESAHVVEGDYEDERAVARLVKGADGLFVVSLPEGEERVAKHEAVLQAGAAADVGHVVYLSFLNPSYDAAFAQGAWHAATEEDLRRLLPGRGTAIRPSLYSQALDGAAGVRDGHALIAPAGAGAVAPIDRRDVGPVIARVLLDASHRGESVELTGPTQATWSDVAAALPEDLHHQDAEPEHFAALLRAQGRPESLIAGMLGLFEDIRAGSMARTTDAVRRIGGVEPHRLEDTFGDGPRALVRRFTTAMADHDPSAFASSIAEDYLQHNAAVPPGREGLAAAFEAFLEAVPDLTVSLTGLVADDDQVAARFAWTGGGRRWTSADWWRVADGRLAEHWDELDPAVFATT